MAEFMMPSLGADMESAALVHWLVKPGDHVKRGDVIAEVETDKGVIEIEVFEEGVVDQLLVEPSPERLPVGAVLAMIRTNGAPMVAPAAVERAAAVVEAAAKPEVLPPSAAPSQAQPPVPCPEKRVRVSPLARKLAADLGIDLNIVQGSGAHGAIERADVERAAAAKKLPEIAPVPPAPPPVVAAPAAAPPAPAAVPPSPPPAAAAPAAAPAKPDTQAAMRRAIAAAMARSNREIPHYYLQTRIDMSRALKWLEAENLKRPLKQRLLLAVLLLKAVSRALIDVPELNGYWLDDHHEPQEAIHIGFAISLRQGGLIAPAIHNVDLLSLDELMEAMHDLIARTRSGGLRGSEMTDGTITVTNLGDMGVETVYGVIYPPQVALVGFGKVVELPWAESGMLGIRPVLTATLAADHRATDGRRGGQFLDALTQYLQEVEKL
jgi:pyruvate dehydrogenase E2 component (dihydrolipoamide acetyltransferase)